MNASPLIASKYRICVYIRKLLLRTNWCRRSDSQPVYHLSHSHYCKTKKNGNEKFLIRVL
uniref:Uncharacterized protein n=1 Tax=Anguilla anguilla TaxID=7936 RepID=A0A0E9X3S5_ANGAN